MNIRPKTFDEFVGQDLAIRQIRLALSSAKTRGDVIDHVLLVGPPGLGKTTIAHVIAGALGTRCIETNANAIKNASDATASLVSLRRGDVIFIDEIHALPVHVQEYLYPAMEDYKLHMVSKVSQRTAISIELHKFVLVGATTIEGLLSAPMLDRFGIICRLRIYTDLEIRQIVLTAAKKESIKVTDDALDLIASRARATPRVALRQLRRIRDSATAFGNSQIITKDAALHAYSVLGIGHHGLTEQDLAVLKALVNSEYAVGVAALASQINSTVQTIETVIEPHLMRIGAVERTPRGRRVTEFGKKLLQ